MGRPPTIWVLLGQRAGDNAQAIELARLLGWPAEQKHLRYGAARIIPNLALGASLASLDRAKSDALLPPWPDLVIAIGKRSVPLARWIRAQNGGRTKLVHLGRPRAPLDWFDLVITTPQYALPAAGNVVEIPLPLVPAQQPPRPAHEDWHARFKPLPRPWTGVLVGGSRFPFILDETEAARLAGDITNDIGSVLVSTSPRTGAGVTAVLKEKLGSRGFVYDWSQGGPNPHQAILDLADTFVVTSDSVSMIAEAAATGRPSRIFELKRRAFAPRWEARQGLAATLARTGILVPPRDPSRVRIPEQPYNIEPLLERIRRLAQHGP